MLKCVTNSSLTNQPNYVLYKSIMDKNMIFETEKTLLETYTLENLVQLNLARPDIQRNWQWKSNNQNNLIISILKNSPIGQFLVWNETSSNTMYITDGRHRYTVISNFMNNKFPVTVKTESGTKDYYYGSDDPIEEENISLKLGGKSKTWNFLSKEERNAFRNKEVSVTFVHTDDAEKISEMFMAINTASSNLCKVDLLVCKHHKNAYMKRIDKLFSIEIEKDDQMAVLVSDFYRAIGHCNVNGNYEKHLAKLKANPKVQKREFFEMYFMVRSFTKLCRDALNDTLNSYRMPKMNKQIEDAIISTESLSEQQANADFVQFVNAVREMNLVSPIKDLQKFQFIHEDMKNTFNKRLFCILMGLYYAYGTRLPLHFRDVWCAIYNEMSEKSTELPTNGTDSSSAIVAGIQLIEPYFSSAFNNISLSARVGK